MRAVLILGLVVLANPVRATSDVDVQKHYTKAYDICENTGEAAQGVTPAMRACINAEFDRQDAALNLTYHRVMAHLPAGRQVQLRNSQRTWIKMRDKQCNDDVAQEEGGTIAPQEYTGCQTDETIRRTIWLERYR